MDSCSTNVQLQPTCVYLCERVLKFAQLVSTKSQLSLARCTPLSVQERSERLFLRSIERPTMSRHIRMQQSTDPRVQAYIHPYIVNCRTHLINFSSRSASHPSPSSPSGPYGVGSVSSRTSRGTSPCARNARNVAVAVSACVGSATIDA